MAECSELSGGMENRMSQLEGQLNEIKNLVQNLASQNSDRKANTKAVGLQEYVSHSKPDRSEDSTTASHYKKCDSSLQVTSSLHTRSTERLPKQPKSLGSSDLSIICTNVPESNSTSIQGRSADEQNQWETIVKSISAPLSPVSLTRLVRHHKSTHFGEPRLLRVTFKTEKDMEAVLLSSYKLRQEAHKIRIFPDVPWIDRQKRKNAPTTRDSHDVKSVYIHGVPEVSPEDVGKTRDHDHTEWAYILTSLSLENVCATSITRVPRSPNYLGNGPRIMKVSLLTDDMVNVVCQCWKQNRYKFPSELRLKPSTSFQRTSAQDVPIPDSEKTKANENMSNQYLPPIPIDSPCLSSKNAHLPIQ
jgi:hypothetical protein